MCPGGTLESGRFARFSDPEFHSSHPGRGVLHHRFPADGTGGLFSNVPPGLAAVGARRPSGTRRGSVIATTEDLDHWVATCPMQHGRALKALASSARIEALRKQIQERRQLCARMSELRANVGLALNSLSENIQRVSARQDRHEQPVVAQRFAVDDASAGVLSPRPLSYKADSPSGSAGRSGIRRV
jgi:hypothetical protein